MELLDPATGRPLPSDAIQRVLFLAKSVHVYNIPPLTSMRGHNAASWTAEPSRHIFTARLRVVETAFSSSEASQQTDDDATNLKVDVVLEDPSNGQLFAAAPYTSQASVEPVVDSSRFFAVTVRDQSGRKAVLGIGFEERSDAFDLAVALQEARRSLGLDAKEQNASAAEKAKENVKDYSLKEGETITVSLGKSALGRRRPQQQQQDAPVSDIQSFALAPPPGPSSNTDASGGGFSLPPPPSAEDVKRKRRSLRDMGFDDGQFGEFA
ncbi:hypothetical protein HIM_07554 [Hirsutella minnesotensis 3608]|uniref:NECAP PHear domain-containing protein n=1 Tax=Hirsutella minnesotensis 3608 TaxID=1043627 RepID=A0A0F7ZYS5_9HYPO|nr:hypothetical protein HIM_07554 [Hirsutella minnesotensis 3608]